MPAASYAAYRSACSAERCSALRGWPAGNDKALRATRQAAFVGAGLGAGAVLGAVRALGVLGGLGAVVAGGSRFHAVCHFSSSPYPYSRA